MLVTSSLRRLLWHRAAAILLTTAALVLTAGTPAHAAIPSGLGWSASWRYYTGTDFEFSATLPGVSATGYGVDPDGNRSAFVTVSDTANDSRCARVVMVVPGQLTIGSAKVCDGEAPVNINGLGTTYDGHLYVIVYRAYVFSTDYDKVATLVVPPSKQDPGLRSTNTGASWKYTTASTFQYQVRRPDVHLVGYGSHQGNSRSAFSSVQKTMVKDDLFVCASGKVSGPGASATGQTCVNNAVQVFNDDGFTSGMTVEVCRTSLVPKRCLSTSVPKPM